ncbi:MAG: polymer-forming cytoskeletal protein, partial [Anaerolineae bacterium]
MKKIVFAFVVALLLALSASPALAQDGDDEGRVVFGQDVTIKAGEEVEGDLVVFDGRVTVEEGGKVDGDLVAIGGDVFVSGEVDGDLVAVGGNVRLTATAVIDGDVAAIGGDLDREEGATVRGNIVKGLDFGRFFRFRGAPRTTFRVQRNLFLELFFSFLRTVVVALALTALGLLVVLFLPQQTQLVSHTALDQALPSLGVGFLTVLVVSVLLPLLVIICIGIPAAVLLGLALGVAGLFGWIAIGLLVGERILEVLNVGEPLPLVAVTIGVLLISFLAAVPCIGWIVALFGGLLGLGAVILTRFGTQAYPA